MEFDLIVQK